MSLTHENVKTLLEAAFGYKKNYVEPVRFLCQVSRMRAMEMISTKDPEMARAVQAEAFRRLDLTYADLVSALARIGRERTEVAAVTIPEPQEGGASDTSADPQALRAFNAVMSMKTVYIAYDGTYFYAIKRGGLYRVPHGWDFAPTSGLLQTKNLGFLKSRTADIEPFDQGLRFLGKAGKKPIEVRSLPLGHLPHFGELTARPWDFAAQDIVLDPCS